MRRPPPPLGLVRQPAARPSASLRAASAAESESCEAPGGGGIPQAAAALLAAPAAGLGPGVTVAALPAPSTSAVLLAIPPDSGASCSAVGLSCSSPAVSLLRRRPLPAAHATGASTSTAGVAAIVYCSRSACAPGKTSSQHRVQVAEKTGSQAAPA